MYAAVLCAVHVLYTTCVNECVYDGTVALTMCVCACAVRRPGSKLNDHIGAAACRTQGEVALGNELLTTDPASGAQSCVHDATLSLGFVHSSLHADCRGTQCGALCCPPGGFSCAVEGQYCLNMTCLAGRTNNVTACDADGLMSTRRTGAAQGAIIAIVVPGVVWIAIWQIIAAASFVLIFVISLLFEGWYEDKTERTRSAALIAASFLWSIGCVAILTYQKMWWAEGDPAAFFCTTSAANCLNPVGAALMAVMCSRTSAFSVRLDWWLGWMLSVGCFMFLVVAVHAARALFVARSAFWSFFAACRARCTVKVTWQWKKKQAARKVEFRP